MKKNKLIFFIITIMLPFNAFAMPAFPMAFYGEVKLNGNNVPNGTILNSYYGDYLAGTVVVNEEGIYGYTDVTKQKLLVGEGEGEIIFKIKHPSFNGGVETTGDIIQTHPSFSNGEVVNKNFNFTKSTTPSSSSGNGSSSSSSGGGGGGGSSSVNSPQPMVLGESTSSISEIEKLILENRELFTHAHQLGIALPQFILTTLKLSPAPMVNNVSYCSALLKLGSRGECVKVLQQKLNLKGHLPALVSDGVFGQGTLIAVKKFQVENNLTGDGVVGNITWSFLNK